MEIPQVDGNQKDQEKADKKIIGRGFRPALKIPKNFPYPLELRNNSQSVKLEFDENHNRLYLADDRLYLGDVIGSTAFVEIHPRGLRFVWDKREYIIPGELSLAKTVDLLTIGYTTIKQVTDNSDIEKIFIEFGFSEEDTTLSDIMKITRDAEDQIKSLALKHRKREIAGALLANNLWQKRGFFDKEKIAPKNFWQIIPVKELMIGDKRNLKEWWEDALVCSVRNLPVIENYGIDDYKNKYEIDIEKKIFLKSIQDKIKEGFLPKYPWEIRHWDKIPFEPLKKSLLYGLHKMPEWEAYTKCGALQIQSVIEVLQYGYVTEKDNLEEIVSNIENGIYKKLQKNMSFQPFKTEEEKHLEGRNILNKIGRHYNLSNPIKSLMNEKMPLEKIDFIDIFKDKRKDQFVVPDFLCADGWEWDKNRISFIASRIIGDQEKECHDRWKYGDSFEKIEKNGMEDADLLKCIAIKHKNGIQKEAILMMRFSNKLWLTMGYLNCDINDFREVNVFCRTLNVIKKELKPKTNTDTTKPDIQKEKSIEKPLFPNSIIQSNQTGGR